MRAQVSLDAMVSIAAFIALLALLISAASYSAEKTQAAGRIVAEEKTMAGQVLSQEVIGADEVEFSVPAENVTK
jgi:hypothetical protein